jgi:HPt (histidine-containing phosphotransfer) domain-containing protein
VSDVDALLATLRAEYASRLPAKLVALEDLAARGAWDEFRRAAHKLRGSAATHGFAALGNAAAQLEGLTTDASGSDAARTRASIEAALDAARAEIERASKEPG